MLDETVDASAWIRPGRPTRAWMDQSQGRYAYRCIPLSAANTMGWEILNPVACEVRWNGMTPAAGVYVWTEQKQRWGPRAHFGSGIVTWELPFLFRTPAGFGLAVSGPANTQKHGAAPLDGFIRTDWLPFPFTMNWRLTGAERTIRFEAGEPIARIYPYPLGVLDDFEIETAGMDDDPEFRKAFEEWSRARRKGYEQRSADAERLQRGDQIDPSLRWNRRYVKGEGAEPDVEHQTVFRLKPVKTGRE